VHPDKTVLPTSLCCRTIFLSAVAELCSQWQVVKHHKSGERECMRSKLCGLSVRLHGQKMRAWLHIVVSGKQRPMSNGVPFNRKTL
jgi:hypothetical protein